MGSVSSPPLSSFAPDRPASAGPSAWKSAALTVSLAAGVMAMRSHASADIATLVTLAVLCTAWQCHLERASLRWGWSGPLAVIVTALLLANMLRIPAHPANLRAAALLAGLLLYGMIWALAGHDSKRGLQAVASIALLLPFALFARPQVLFAAMFIGLLAMFCCGRKYGGYLQSALLVFTPVTLCILVAFVLHTLAIATIRFPIWRVHLLSQELWRDAAIDGMRIPPMVPTLAFAFGTLVVRMAKGKTGIPDLAYLVLLVGSVAEVLFHPSGDTRTISEIEVAMIAGAMALIAVAPPRRRACLIFLLLVSVIALAFQVGPILH